MPSTHWFIRTLSIAGRIHAACSPCFPVWGAILLAVACGAAAQDYPNRVVRLVTSEAGGGSDLAARIVTPLLSNSLGQPVVVENRGGGVIAGEVVAKSAPDGHTLLVYGNTFWLLPLMRASVSYDPVRDFMPVSLMAMTPSVMVIHPSMPAQSVSALIALAKAKPGVLNYSSAAPGTTSQLGAELFKAMTGVNIVRDRKSTRLNSSHTDISRMPSSA